MLLPSLLNTGCFVTSPNCFANDASWLKTSEYSKVNFRNFLKLIDKVVIEPMEFPTKIVFSSGTYQLYVQANPLGRGHANAFLTSALMEYTTTSFLYPLTNAILFVFSIKCKL